MSTPTTISWNQQVHEGTGARARHQETPTRRLIGLFRLWKQWLSFVEYSVPILFKKPLEPGHMVGLVVLEQKEGEDRCF